MSMVRLGFRNLWRDKLRLGIVAVLIGIPFFFFLSLEALNRAVESQTGILKQGVDVTLQARARGSLGHVNMVGNDRLLSHEALEKVRAIEHVLQVEPYLLAMNPTEGHNFAMHVGLNLGDRKRLESHGEAGSPRMIAGRDFISADSGKPLALIGQAYAKWANITPESLPATFTVNPTRSNPIIYPIARPEKELTVVGIYASGYVFGDQQLFMPLEILRDIYGIEQGWSWLFVTADSVEHVAQVEQKMREVLGAEADIISPKAAAELASVVTQAIQRMGMAMKGIALLLMAMVIFFIMLLLVRERAREIGALKALGATNAAIVAQFLTETFGLGLVGEVVGLGLFQAFGGLASGHLFSLGFSALLPAHYRTLFDSLSVYYEIRLFTLGQSLLLCVLVTFLGSAYGLWQIIKLSPLEAMKHE